MRHHATCPSCGGYSRARARDCATCRRERSTLRVGEKSYINTNYNVGGWRIRVARTFELCGVALTYAEIAAFAGVRMNTVQKRVSAGTPLFAMRLRA